MAGFAALLGVAGTGVAGKLALLCVRDMVPEAGAAFFSSFSYVLIFTGRQFCCQIKIQSQVINEVKEVAHTTGTSLAVRNIDEDATAAGITAMEVREVSDCCCCCDGANGTPMRLSLLELEVL